MVDLFKNSTNKVPENDPMIVRVPLEQQDIGGRKSHLPNQDKSQDMSIRHTPSSNGKD